MRRSRRIMRLLSPLLAALAFLSVAGGLDRFYSAFAGDPGCLGAALRCGLWRFAATALFAFLALIYVRVVGSTPAEPLALQLASFVIALIVIVYPYVQSYIPFLSYYSLRPIPLLASIHMALAFSEPRSFLRLSALFIAIAVSFCLAPPGTERDR